MPRKHINMQRRYDVILLVSSSDIIRRIIGASKSNLVLSSPTPIDAVALMWTLDAAVNGAA